MLAVVAFISAFVAVQSLTPVKFLQHTSKATRTLGQIKATHYDSISETREVKVRQQDFITSKQHDDDLMADTIIHRRGFKME